MGKRHCVVDKERLLFVLLACDEIVDEMDPMVGSIFAFEFSE